jgi:hypothetical protein
MNRYGVKSKLQRLWNSRDAFAARVLARRSSEMVAGGSMLEKKQWHTCYRLT